MKGSVIAPTLLACLMSATLTYARPLKANFDLAARDVAESPYDALYIRDIEAELFDLEARDLKKQGQSSSSTSQATPGAVDVDLDIDTNGSLPGGKEKIDLKIDDPQQQSRGNTGSSRRGGRRGNLNGRPDTNGKGQQHPQQHQRSHSSHGVGPRDVVESPYYTFSARDFEAELEVRDDTKKDHPNSKPGQPKPSAEEVTDVDVSVDTNGSLPGGKENIDLQIDSPQPQSRPGSGRRGGRRGNLNGGRPNPNGRVQQHPQQHQRSHSSHGVGPRDVVESPYYAFSARNFEGELEVRDDTKKDHPNSKPGQRKPSTEEVTDVDVSVDTNGSLPGGKENIDLQIDSPQRQSRPGPSRRGGRRENPNGRPNTNGMGQQHPQQHQRSHSSHSVGPRDVVESPYYFSA